MSDNQHHGSGEGYRDDTPPDYEKAELVPDDEEAPGKELSHKSTNHRSDAQRKKILMVIGFVICFLLLLVVIVGILQSKGGSSAGDELTTDKNIEKAEARPTSTSLSEMFTTIQPVSSPSTSSPTGAEPPLSVSTRQPTLSPRPSSSPAPTGSNGESTFLSQPPTPAMPDLFDILPSHDTYITNGVEKFESEGQKDTILVQRGMELLDDAPESFGLMAFELDTLPPFGRIRNRLRQAVLVLHHVPAVQEREAVTYSIERLPRTTLDIEAFHFGSFPMPNRTTKGPDFAVAPDDFEVRIDVTDLLFGGSNEDDDESQFFVMIVDRGEETEVGDRFFTKEVEDAGQRPHLQIELGAIVPTEPTPIPASPPPTTLAPSVSMMPSLSSSFDANMTFPEVEPDDNLEAPATNATNTPNEGPPRPGGEFVNATTGEDLRPVGEFVNATTEENLRPGGEFINATTNEGPPPGGREQSVDATEGPPRSGVNATDEGPPPPGEWVNATDGAETGDNNTPPAENTN